MTNSNQKTPALLNGGNLKVINIIGGPGVGKSVLRAQIYSYLKTKSNLIEETFEFAKELTLKSQLDTLKNNQILVLGVQLQRLLEIENNGFEAAITDSPLILSSIYNKKYTSLKNICIEAFNQFDNLTLFLERDTLDYETLGRSQKIEQAMELDSDIKNFLKENALSFECISRKEALSESLSKINSKWPSFFNI